MFEENKKSRLDFFVKLVFWVCVLVRLWVWVFECLGVWVFEGVWGVCVFDV